MTGLTEADRHFWGPIPEVVTLLANRLPIDAKVLEIGASHVQFPSSTMFVDFQDVPGIPPEKIIKCDITKDQLPFPDKHFDFVYCRHVLEDCYNPFSACEEMSRVAKAGYIETPSPIAELCRGVDGGSPPYRGYHHHRYIVWNIAGTLNFVAKYPIIEYLSTLADQDEAMFRLLQGRARHWNTHFLWSENIDVKHYQNTLDFNMMIDYPSLLRSAIAIAKMSYDEFFEEIGHAA